MSHSLENDLVQLMARAWKVYKVLSKGPEQLYSSCVALLSMIASLRRIDEIVSLHQISSTDEDTILDLNARCTTILSSLESGLTRFKSIQTDMLGLFDANNQIEELVNEQSSILEGLQERYSRHHLTMALEQLVDTSSKDSLHRITSDWTILVAELRRHGVALDIIEDEVFYIRAFLDAHEEEDEPLPGYTPGARPGTLAEKVQTLEQTTKLMSVDQNRDPISSSSKASPPPYTFDSEADQAIDEKFLKYIHRAVEQEASRRFLKRQESPSAGPQPYSWLPQFLQRKYSGLKYLAPLSFDCFTVMAYESISQCTMEIDRFTNLLRVSFEHKYGTATEKVVQEAPASLKVLSIACAKFILLQDQRSAQGNFSDLDSLDYEHSTANFLENKSAYEFPCLEFELARKRYYNLLTYIMGILQVFSEIFQGRTYLIRPPTELEYLWSEHKMASRTAWIEKQLTAWDEVEKAVLHCRSLRALHPELRDQAMKMLDKWNETETVLSGRAGDEIMTLTVVSVSGLPKPTIGQLSTFVRVILYVPKDTTGAYRQFEAKTDVCSRTQFPVWNKSFVISVPNDSKWVDLELYDRVAGLEKYLGRRRLEFSVVPGVEATFANRSLIHGIDEEIDFPMNLSVDTKGKGLPVFFRVGLKWQGRVARCEDLGLPINPPGKMFRTDLAGILF